MVLQTTPSPRLPGGVRTLLRKRIESNLDLPFQSDSSALVLSLCNDERCDAQKLSELIQRDQALAGHVLAVSNSAAYAPKERIVSLQQAISRLGISVIYEISLAVSLKGKVFDVPGFATQVRDMWIHSASAAIYAKEIARSLRKNVEGAFLCGLLHDVGRPIVLQNLVDVAREKTELPVPFGILDAAMEEFHAPVGALLVEHWELAEWMVDVVAHHHDYRNAGESVELAMIVNLADELAKWAHLDGVEEEDFDTSLCVINDLNLYKDDIHKLLQMRSRVLGVGENFL